MATRYITRSALLTIKQTLTSVAVARHSLRHRPLIATASAFNFGRDEGNVFSARSFATRQTTSSLIDPNPNFTNRPPKETILLDGCDFEHWLVVMEKPEGDPSRDEIIDSYIKTLAVVVGSEEEARMKIYSVSTRHYFAFGALVSEELSYKLKELPRVRWVLPDSYLDVKNEDYGGEPFINGQAVPYDPKYHEEWVRNNARANDPKRQRNNRPRNFDRPRNFERSREMQTTNQHPGGQQNMDQRPPPPSGPHTGAMNPNMHQQPDMGAQPNYGPNPGDYQPSYQHGNAPNSGVPHQSNTGPYNINPGPGFVPNAGSGPSHNQGGYAPNSGPVQNQGGYGPNMDPGPVPDQGGYAPNSGPVPVQNQSGYAQDRSGLNPYQGQNMSGRD